MMMNSSSTSMAAMNAASSSSSTNNNVIGGGSILIMSANPMNFTENQQGNVVLEKLRQQRESGRFCDVVLAVQDRQFPAHRNILAACSPYFDSILRMHKVVKEMVTVTCQNPDVFELLLNYMYSGNVVIDRHNVAELLKLAHNFLVSKLKNYCAEYLDRYLDAQNCLGVKELAEKYNMPGLAKNAGHFAETNINAVLLESHDLLEYPLCRVEQTISEKSYTNVTFEAQLRFVARYVRHRVQEREPCFTSLLASIRSNLERRPDAGNSVTILDFVDREPLFHQNPSLLLPLSQFARENRLDALATKCERYYHSLTRTSGIDDGDNGSGAVDQPPMNDVSIYFNNNNGHNNDGSSTNNEEDETDVAAGYSNMDDNNESMNGYASSSHNTSIDDIVRATIRVKEEPPESPPPNNDSSFEMPGFATAKDALSTNDHSSSTSAITASSTSDFPPLRIKLRLGDRLSMGRILDEAKPKRKSAAARIRTALSENGGDDMPTLPPRRGRPPKNRDASSISGGEGSSTSATMTTRRSNGNAVIPAAVEIPAPFPFDEDDEEPMEEEDLEGLNEEYIEEDDHFSSTDEEEEEEMRKADGAKAEILFKCPHCVYTSGSQSRIQSHIEKAHRKNRTFVCTVCGFECKWNREYYMHMKEHFQGPPFCCDNCDYTAERIQMLLTHRMKHTDERPFECKECDYRCRTKTNLVAHMRSHTGEKPFSCPACYRSFAIKSTLDQHLATHSDARPFVCDQCSFSTKYQSHLISHKRIHTGDVFHCQYPDCTYSSPKKSQLAAHMRTHMAVRAHVCKQCGRSFIEKSHLVRHERIHLQIKPFKCDQCNYASSRRDKLKEHVQKHHVPGAPASNHYRQQASGPVKNPFCRTGKRGGRSRRMSFGFGGGGGSDGARARRISSMANGSTGGGGRFSASLIACRPHSSIGFRPITPQLNAAGQPIIVDGHHHHQLVDPSGAGTSATPGGGQPLMDFSGLLTSPTLPAYQPSPFEGQGDVLLSTQTGGLMLMSDSPHSTTNSLLSDPFPSAATPQSDPLQRPMSLPPLGAQTTEFNLLNSFMAMF